MGNDFDVPVQLAVGSQWKSFYFEKLLFNLEVGFDVSDAYTYMSLSATLQFDEHEGLVIR